ncbi:MAG: isoleucine--tRNA ligase [Ignavibacteriales bacterium]|nr:isoleucine--tRNA ligase [Ignavibacteriales bacterium]
MFKEYKNNYSYPKIEEEILKFWSENNIFEKSLQKRKDSKNYVFYEGPPTANGKPGIHHVMARTLKDIICRYKTIQGYLVTRKAGWDTHGLPVEIEVEKTLGIKNKSEIPEYGIAKYNQACKNSVFTYLDLWEKMTDRMGYWINMEHPYITCTNEYIESLWWALKKLFDKGLIYKDYKIVPQCPRSETVLSSHELALGYKQTKDPSVYVLMKLKKSKIAQYNNTYFLVWTTTPWTLISNVALAVGAEIDYVKIKTDEKFLILAESRLSVIKNEYEIIERFRGKDLANQEYEQLLNYLPVDKKGFYVIEGDFVSLDDGSGIVHIAPAFGADDYEMLKKFNLPFLQPVTRNGLFTKEVTDFAGMFVKDADAGIIDKLKAEGKLYKKETIVHSYPFSWRFDNVPVIYYARESWFIKTTAIADRMVELNKTINWFPKEVGAGRFGNWLEENKDWALSRDRFWATPLPIWINEDGDMFAVGSIEELKEGFIEKDGKRISIKDIEEIDLHKPFVDEVKFEKNGKIYTRTPELIDAWFDSGAMPFAQHHYPFENKELFENNFPCDFISEGIDQTRGWFYTLHALGTLLFDSVAYKNVLVNELILDKKGLKMSKSRGNTVDPFMLFDKYGADATRWYLIINSPPWRPTLFDEDGIIEVQRKFFGTLINTYSFFALYANIDKIDFNKEFIPFNERPEIDRWIISKLSSLCKTFERYMDEYDMTKAARAVSDFTIDDLSNWYVRRNRRRFWKSEVNKNKTSAYQTLFECLLTISELISPIAPFISEELYQNLKIVLNDKSNESIHLKDFPEIDYYDGELEEKMDIAQRIVFLARAIRARTNLKVRQPLKKIMVAIDSSKKQAVEKMKDIILEEINIKELFILEDDSSLVKKSAKPNFKSIGPKYGKIAQQVANQIKFFDKIQVEQIEKEGFIEIIVEDVKVNIKLEDIEIVSVQIEGWVIESDNKITVAIDTELTEELISEGYAREFINRVQNLRKDNDFDIVDRISIKVDTDEKLFNYINNHISYVRDETLADLVNQEKISDNTNNKFQVGEFDCKIEINKIEKNK